MLTRRLPALLVTSVQQQQHLLVSAGLMLAHVLARQSSAWQLVAVPTAAKLTVLVAAVWNSRSNCFGKQHQQQQVGVVLLMCQAMVAGRMPGVRLVAC